MDTPNVPILLVDDQPANLLALEAILAGPTVSLVKAASGAEALELAREQEFAAILLDVMMPEMDGFAVAEHLTSKGVNRATPIIFLSAMANDQRYVGRGYEVGGVDYLTKPLIPEQVRAKVNVFVELARQRHKINRQAAALAAGEARNKAVIEQAHDAFILMDADGRVVEWNTQAELTLGWSKAEAIGRLVEDLVLPLRYRDAHRRGILRYFNTGDGPVLGRRVEVSALHRAGHEIPIEISVAPIPLAGGGMVFSSFLRDITVRKRQEQLQVAQLRATSLLATADSLEAVLPSFLQALCESLDWCRAEVWLAREGAYERIDAHAVRDGSRLEARAFPLEAEGQHVGVLLAYSSTRKETPAAVLNVMGDIAARVGLFLQRKRAEDELLKVNRELEARVGMRTRELVESEKRFRVMADTSPQIIWATSPEGQTEYCNRLWYTYTGQTEAETMAEGSWAAIHPDDRAATLDAWNDAITRRGVFEVEHRLLRHDGVYRWHHCKAVPVFDDDGDIIRWIGTNADIDDRRRSEAELRRASEIAEAASRAKSAFLANMSHEIRTPLNAIVGFTEFLLEPDLTPIDRHEFAATIRRNSRLLAQLIDDILDLSKVEAGKLTIERLPCSVPAILADVRASVVHQAREKGLDLRFRSDGAVPEWITCDPTRLKQILINIVGNSVKFTSQGSVDVSVSAGAGVLSFLVSDTGRGISDDHKACLFQPFSQGDASTTRQFGGTGLGLALTRRLAQALGGDVRLVETRLGQGSTFLVTVETGASGGELLMPERGLARVDASDERVVARRQRLAGVRILVAEDSADSRALIDRVLKLDGADVETAENGIEAVERALTGGFDAILMDVQMPRRDGLEATAELRRLGYTGPIIALTAHAMTEEREKCLRAGCDDHLTKPINAAEIVGKLAEIAGQRGGPAQLPH